jgi:hypothetical protein
VGVWVCKGVGEGGDDGDGDTGILAQLAVSPTKLRPRPLNKSSKRSPAKRSLGSGHPLVCLFKALAVLRSIGYGQRCPRVDDLQPSLCSGKAKRVAVAAIVHNLVVRAVQLPTGPHSVIRTAPDKTRAHNGTEPVAAGAPVQHAWRWTNKSHQDRI